MPTTPERACRWARRRGAAVAVRWTVRLVPFFAATGLAALVGSAMPDSPGIPWLLVRLAAVTVSATVVMRLVGAVLRRALPLATLLDLTLIFPDRAPSRLRLAMSAASSVELTVLFDRYRSTGAHEPATAAAHLLQLVGALSRHDHLTRGHSERVRAYTQMIGEELGLDRDQLDTLRWAALIHDIGKLHIDAAILNKPGKLTREEFAIIMEHPARGAELAAPLAGWLGDSALAIAQHHEKWNGRGYPQSLRGEQISLAARIVAVADAFDVMTSARSYKQPVSAAEARAELAHCAGSHFDPEVVRAFLAVSLGRLRRVIGPLSWFTAWAVAGRPSMPANAKPSLSGAWRSTATTGTSGSTSASVASAASSGGMATTAFAGLAAASLAVTVVAPIDVLPTSASAEPSTTVVVTVPVATPSTIAAPVVTEVPAVIPPAITDSAPLEPEPTTPPPAPIEVFPPAELAPEEPSTTVPAELTPIDTVAPSEPTVAVIEPTTTAVQPADAPCPETTDWTAEYWPNSNLEGARIVCAALPAVDFNWEYSSPEGVPNEAFSARYTKSVVAAGPTLSVTVGSDDGMRLYVDGVLVADAWKARTYKSDTYTVPVTEGPHTVVVEYYERTGRARVLITVA